MYIFNLHKFEKQRYRYQVHAQNSNATMANNFLKQGLEDV